jgi:mannose-6-phosphate isomerase-like protein (cupin superfamily)
MSRFTIKNLKELEDSASERAPGIEGARKHLDSGHLGVSYFRYAPDVRSPMGHSHREQEEVYVVINGSGRRRNGVRVTGTPRAEPTRSSKWSL